jgi:transforming growth factor-beta-induced protein
VDTEPVVVAPAPPPVASPASDPNSSIANFLSSSSDLSDLTGALDRAGFLGVLNSAGNYTVFAPSNNAFAPISAEFKAILNNVDFLPHLQDLLLFHIVSGKFYASDLALFAGGGVRTFNGQFQPIASPPLTINGVPVVLPDNDLGNGVVHIIDDVFAPNWVSNSITSRVNADTAELSILSQLLILAQFDLSGLGGAFTLLAPTNAAFNALPDGALEYLSDEANLVELQTILVYHLIFGVYTVGKLVNGLQLPSALTNATVVVNISGTNINFNETPLGGQSDILAFNGVVQKINSVLNPNDSPTGR